MLIREDEQLESIEDEACQNLKKSCQHFKQHL